MQIYLVSEWTSKIPSWVFEENKYPQVYGITVRLPFSNFVDAGGGWNEGEMNELINDLKLIASYGKKIAIGVAFGKFTPALPGIRFVTISDSHHNIPGHEVPTRQPVFWDGAFKKIHQNFFKWFSDRLKESEVWGAIEQVKITIANEKTEELKCSDQNWESPSDSSAMAFLRAAQIWDSVGYTTPRVKMVIGGAIDLFHELFPDKIIALPVIGGLAGFPRFNVDGICKPKEAEDLSKELIEYGVLRYDNFAPESTALAIDTGTPDSVCKSGAKNIILQVRRQWYSPDPPFPKSKLDQDIFQLVIQNGINHNATIVEVFKNTLLSFPNMHG